MRPQRPEKFFKWEGKNLSVSDWARIKGVNKLVILGRLHRKEKDEHILYKGDLRKLKKKLKLEEPNG